MKNYYPFSAIVGQNEMKLALILSIINPKIKGVLIFGEKGTGKSSAVRSISQLLGKEIVNLPLNVSEDMLVGTIDLEKTVLESKPVLEYGIFKKAHNNILYIDEVNLLKDSITDIILQVNSGDENLIEREGISEKHDSEFMLVGTMNEEEGFLRGEFLDRFGIAVRVCGEKDEENRFKILKRNDEYENNFKTFIESYKFEENRLLEKINHASKILNKTDGVCRVTDALIAVSHAKGDVGMQVFLFGLRFGVELAIHLNHTVVFAEALFLLGIFELDLI